MGQLESQSWTSQVSYWSLIKAWFLCRHRESCCCNEVQKKVPMCVKKYTMYLWSGKCMKCSIIQGQSYHTFSERASLLFWPSASGRNLSWCELVCRLWSLPRRDWTQWMSHSLLQDEEISSKLSFSRMDCGQRPWNTFHYTTRLTKDVIKARLLLRTLLHVVRLFAEFFCFFLTF